MAVAIDSSQKWSRVSDAKLGIDDLPHVLSQVMANRAKWELLGIRLGIDNGTIEAIKSKNHGISTLCLKEVLSTWLNENYDTQQHGYPSWRRLCKVIASPAGAENQSLADDIAEQHKTPLKEGYTMSHGRIQVSLKPDVPERVVFLMIDYTEMLQVLRDAKLSKSRLCALKMFLSDYCEESSIRECSTVSNIVDLLIDKMMIYILNIDTLKASCIKFGDCKVKCSVEQYKQHLDEFLSSTSVKEFEEALQTEIVNFKSVECITLQLDEDRACDTLKKLKQFIYHLFGNISKAFILCEVFAGCVCVTWLVPISLIPTLRTMAEQLSREYLASHGVLKLVIGGEKVFSLCDPTVIESSQSMFGILLDVSNSMRSAYALDVDRVHNTSIQRTHAVVTTIANIARREAKHHGQQDYIFTCAFGLEEHTHTDICDLIPLFEIMRDSRRQPDPLIELAKQHGAPHAQRWIREYLTKAQASLLYQQLLRDKSLIPQLIQKLPSTFTTTAGSLAKGLFKRARAREEEKVRKSEAYTYTMDIISDRSEEKFFIENLAELPKLRPVQYVSVLLDELLQTAKPAGASCTSGSDVDKSVHDAVQELIDTIKPYIYGYTPMCKAMNQALSIFREVASADKDKPKVLFILSDGESTDGDPCPIAQKLKEVGVTIVTCFLTANYIKKPKRLLDAKGPTWTCGNCGCSSSRIQLGFLCRIHECPCEMSMSGQLALFEMSSTMHNTHTPVSYLIDAGWELPPSGESRLFLQANSLDVVNELCSIVVSQITKGCDALVDILAKVSLATYINQANDGFKAVEQNGDTCYANAVAAVLHLAMQRIVKREGGIPDFDVIRQQIIGKYGDNAITRVVLEKVCPMYRLHYRTVDETGARKAINERRPVITIFRWYEQEYKKFYRFFRNNKKGILKGADLHTSKALTVLGGHAVVLTRCDSNCLTFMNSWGTDFADEGFFRVEDSSVLRDMFFYDVYWEMEDLTLKEKLAFEKKGTRRGKELLQTFPSLQDLPYKCPECKKISKVSKYYGNLLVAKCPQCHENFVPKNEQLLESLYIRNMKY